MNSLRSTVTVLLAIIGALLLIISLLTGMPLGSSVAAQGRPVRYDMGDGTICYVVGPSGISCVRR